MIQCSKCNSDNPDDAIFCKVCGGKFSTGYSTPKSHSSSGKTYRSRNVGKVFGTIITIIITLLIIRVGWEESDHIIGNLFATAMLLLIGNAIIKKIWN